MPKKKSVTKKARIKKEDEELINKRITIGAILTLVFLVLFLSTQVKLQENPKSFDQLIPEDKLQIVHQSQQDTADTINYNKALATGDRRYCEAISDAKLKQDCLAKTPENTASPEPATNNATPQSLSDGTNYNYALARGDSAYCAQIIDDSLKSECYAKVQG